jgi:hypothetical protein
MRLLAAVLLVGCATAHVAPDPEVGDFRWSEPYPVRPEVRARVGMVHVGGDVPRVLDVPYFRGLTLRLALLMAGRDKPNRANAQLVRGTESYTIPLRVIYDGLAPDPELSAGDEVVVTDDIGDLE